MLYTNYRHKKTGNEYIVVGHAIDATNTSTGRNLVIYIRKTGEHAPAWFAREHSEFLIKFEPILP